MPKIITRTVYEFDELNARAKEAARDWWRTLDCDTFEHDAREVIDDAAECGAILGITFDTRETRLTSGKTRNDPAVYYSGFSSQGDGASFAGRYASPRHLTVSVAKAIRKHAPQDERLHHIADALQAMQRAHAYGLTARIAAGHDRYCHSMTMDVEVEDENGDPADDATATVVTDEMRAFADWLYRRLEDEYEARRSDENVDETIRVNEYTFDENGKRAG